MNNKELELLTKTNPVFNTAKMTVYQLAMSGDALAVQFLKSFQFGAETQQEGTSQIPEQVIQINNTTLEMRYRTLTELVKKIIKDDKKGKCAFVDLPCGYTPRSILMAEDGIDYYGLDLKAAIEELCPVVDQTATDDQKKFIHLQSVDATNYQSLDKALHDVEGEICISTEGLMMYFTDSEVEAVVKNVAELLKKHGGCWITPDATSALMFYSATRVFYGDKAMEIMGQMQKMTSNKADINVGNNVFMAFGQEEKAVELLEKYGLKRTLIPFTEYMPELRSFAKMTQEQVEAYKKAMTNVNIWVMTPSSQAKEIEKELVTAEDFTATIEVEKNELKMDITGRLDSITAPLLLKQYEEMMEKENVTSAFVDFTKLEYISSAGLRVLLIMRKNLKAGVTLSSVNETVMEILEQTGFVDLFEIII